MSLLIEYIASLQEDDFKNLSKTSSFLISHATDAPYMIDLWKQQIHTLRVHKGKRSLVTCASD